MNTSTKAGSSLAFASNSSNAANSASDYFCFSAFFLAIASLSLDAYSFLISFFLFKFSTFTYF